MESSETFVSFSFLRFNNTPPPLFLSQMEDLIARMQDEKNGIPIRTVKSFLSKIPSVFSGKERRLFMQNTTEQFK